jgi:hypothetical protein
MLRPVFDRPARRKLEHDGVAEVFAWKGMGR